jgi:hypothetical protein
MKEICLNVAGGKRTDQILSFIGENQYCDVFCFQKVFNHGICTRPVFEGANMDLYSDIQNQLDKHTGFL